MALGLRVHNAASYLQIDDLYKNYVLRQSGVITTNNIGEFLFYFADEGVPPVTLFKHYSASTWLIVKEISRTFIWGCVVSNNGQTPQVGAQVPYALFKRELGAGGGYGLRVRNAAGQLTYDSSQRPLRVSSVVAYEMGATVSSVDIAFAPAVVNPWVMPTANAMYVNSADLGDSGGYEQGYHGFRTSGVNLLSVCHYIEGYANQGGYILANGSTPGVRLIAISPGVY